MVAKVASRKPGVYCDMPPFKQESQRKMIGSAWIKDRQMSELIMVVLGMVGCQYSYWPCVDHISTGGQVKSLSNFMECTQW